MKLLNRKVKEIVNEDDRRETETTLVVEEVVLRVDTPNVNGIVYPRAVVEKALAKYQKKITERRAFGVNEITDPMVIPLNDISMLCTKMELRDNEVVGVVETLATPQGKALTALLESGTMQLGIYSVGSVSEHNIVDEDLEFVGINAFPKNKV